MRTALILASALAAASSSPALAQVSPRAIAVESGVSAPLGGGARAHAPLALSAMLWLEGSADLVLRLAGGSAPRTAGQAAAPWLTGTAGLRWSFAPGPLRPHAFAEIGWAAAGEAGQGRPAFGAGGGLEWFAARDLALVAALALRSAPDGPGWRLDGSVGLAAYF